jgi:hypothetical protein
MISYTIWMSEGLNGISANIIYYILKNHSLLWSKGKHSLKRKFPE